MIKKFWSITQYIFFLGLGFFLVWWQFDKMTDLQRVQFSETLLNANYWVIMPVIIMSVLSHISRAVRWKILIEPLGYKPSIKNTFYSVMSGYLVNTFLPRVGEILKCSLLARYEKIPMNKLLGTIIIERIFDLICYFILIIITFLIQLNYISDFVKQKFEQLANNNRGFEAWLTLLIVILILTATIIILWLIFKKFAHHDSLIKIKNFYNGLREGFNTIRKLKKRQWFLAHTLFIWSMYLMQIYIGFYALSATAYLGITEAFSVLSLATLAMIVSPGGIGAFPLAVQEVLLIYNVDNISFGWLMWGISTTIIIVLGLISFGLLVYKNKRLYEAKPADII
ncbi:MAG: flippase-like domain-containing protein [Chitinophagaceae bacterium]|nr:flippase-like domain-containing protein [Chitinophagaceae bacterium]